ncbi:MAG: hypothetical protein K8I03_02415 [Ignavibacteria bacterium]|nr:hypothetical protein [Ignavibacteria bacterium]
MKYLYSTIIIIISLQVFSVCNYAQQEEDVVYLKNGSIIHGTITEQVKGESIKIKTADGNIFVFKMSEIDKMTKEKVAVKEEVIKNPESDTSKNKNVKTILKTDSTKKKVKLPNASNSMTIQPIGLLTLLTNFEYDRALSGSFSMGLKVSFMTFFLRNAINFEGDKSDVENAEAMKESLSSWGIGTHIRYYPGGRAVEGFFLGLAFEKLQASFDEIKGETGTVKTKTNYTASLSRLEFEIGHRSKLSSKQGGFTIQWTLGAGVGFGSTTEKNESFTVPIGSFGFGIGYSF